VPLLFIKDEENGQQLFVLDYVDNMLYYGLDEERVKRFEELIQQRFNLELMGQAHWYLSNRIHQHGNFGIELDHSRYCRAIVKKYLDSAGI
jgi:hypothetical protein